MQYKNDNFHCKDIGIVITVNDNDSFYYFPLIIFQSQLLIARELLKEKKKF